MMADLLKDTEAILKQLQEALPSGEPTIEAWLATVNEAQAQIAEASAHVDDVMAQIDAWLPSEPAKVEPLRVKASISHQQSRPGRAVTKVLAAVATASKQPFRIEQVELLDPAPRRCAHQDNRHFASRSVRSRISPKGTRLQISSCRK